MSINKYPGSLLLLTVILCCWQHLTAQRNTAVKQPYYDTVYVTVYGATPDSRNDAVPAVQAALEVCRKKRNPLLFFPAGRYDFWPTKARQKAYYESNTTVDNPRYNAILIDNFRQLTVSGNGSSFIYHGRIQPFTIDHSSNVTIRDLAINWDFPLTAQATVLDTAADHIDVSIDTAQYPYRLNNQQLVFAAEGWSGKITGVMEYDAKTHLIAYRTGDQPALGNNWSSYSAEIRGNGVVRLHHRFLRKPAPGNVLVLRHNARDHAMIFVTDSKHIQFQHINGYHCAGLGILSQYTSDLTFSHVNIVPDSIKGRYFSGHDDGLHFSNCSGNIVVDSCRFAGLMDDPINVHGTYVKIIRKLGSNRLLCRFMESMSIGMEWAGKNEKVAFINHHSLQTIGNSKVTAFKVNSPTDFELTLSDTIPAQVAEGDGLENTSWTPNVTVRNSSFESCRARGLLMSTPGKVIVTGNNFSSSGSAILIAGDVNSWYESGAVRDVLIKNNRFLAPCNTSDYQFTEAVISIYPEIPVMNAATPPYHKNIRIVDNVFQAFDYPVLFARSVNGLKFENNKLLRSYDFQPYHENKVTFSLSGCKNVSIQHNSVDPKLLGKNIRLKFMDRAALQYQQELVVE